MKRITRQWLDEHLVCTGGTYPAQLMYQSLADVACQRITAGINRRFAAERPIKAMLDPLQRGRLDAVRALRYLEENPLADRPAPLPRRLGGLRQRLGIRVLPRRRGASAGTRLREEPGASVSRVPYLLGAEPHRYIPDFIVLVDDGRGEGDPLHLVVEIKGYRGEDAKEKKSTMDTYWVPGVNNLGAYGRWAFAEFTDVFAIQDEFNEMIERAAGTAAAVTG